MRLFIKQFYLICLFIPSCLFGATIIFDLGDVLIETNKALSIWHIGPYKFFSYLASWRNPLRSKQLFYDYLNQIKPRTKNEVLARDADGILLPQLMCDWLKGTYKPEEILEFIRITIENNGATAAQIPEYALIQGMAELIFTPALFAQTASIVHEGQLFVQECKEAGHQVYILSNWDAASFDELRALHPDFFALFDGIVISGDVGKMKPDPAIYRYLLDTYGLCATDCIFIDDRPENIATARKLKMQAIQYKKRAGILGAKHDFDAVRAQIFAK